MREERSAGAAAPPAVRWASVGVFYGVALAISWPLFAWRNHFPEAWQAWEAPVLVKAWAPALGPAVAAVLCLWLFRRTHRRTSTLGGTSWPRSLLFVAAPVVALAGLGVGGEQPHLQGLLSGLGFVVYGFLEELGWRGFLLDAVRPLPEARRSVLVGVLWSAWHFTTFARGALLDAAASFLAMTSFCILGSWGLGKALDRTRSVLVVSMLHLLFNLGKGLPRELMLPVVAGCVVAWVALLVTWPPEPAPPVPRARGADQAG